MQAVTQGKWLVIEDINLAPADVLAALIPLLDSRELHLSQRAQTIRAAPTFQLLATITCSPSRILPITCPLSQPLGQENKENQHAGATGLLGWPNKTASTFQCSIRQKNNVSTWE